MPEITDELNFIQAEDPFDSEVSSKSEESDKIKNLLLTIFRKIETQEMPTRELLLRNWKLNQLLWQGIQSVAWSSIANEWQVLDAAAPLPADITIDPSIYNKVINIIRPYGESIAGALSTGLPTVRYFPYNAEDPADINTAKTFSKIEKLIASHNKMELLLLQTLIYLYKFGFAAAYNYSHESEEYGTVSKEEEELRPFNVETTTCSNCGGVSNEAKYEVPKDFGENVEETISEMLPDNLDEVKEPVSCSQCQQIVPTQLQSSMVQEPVKVTNEYNKSRQIVKILSPLEVKIPSRAKSQDQVLWLIYEDEFHVAQLKCLYLEYANKITEGSGSTTAYERYIRSNWEEYYENLNDYVTCDRVWLRPDAYYLLDKEDAALVKKTFPSGVFFTVINDTIVEVKEEKMDDHWTLTINPGDNRIYADAGCKSTVPMQFLTNEIMQLEVECFKYALPTTFADPEFLNFTAYSSSTKSPGLIYPMKKPPNGAMADNVTSLITANYPKDAAELDAKVEKLAQFTSGALPSIWGGPQGGGKTLGEYEQSRNQALQRLGIIWKTVNYWFASLMSKSIKAYIKNMQEDEYFVQKHGDSFINVWIRRSELQGKIGDILPEVSEQFPSSWAQTSAKVMELMGMKNPFIDGILSHPDNLELVAQVLGVPDLYIPGENQRNKELLAIAVVLHTPTNVDPMTGQPIPIQPPPVDPILDEPSIQIEVLKAFLSSDIGQDLQTSNPAAYQALMIRLSQFQFIIAQQMAQQAAQEQMAVNTPPAQ